MNTLVLGLGNLLLGDEGVGVHVAWELEKRLASETVCVSDAGTAVLDFLPQLETVERVIVIDACKGHSKPGTVYLMDIDQCEDKPYIGSVHGFDLKYVLALAGRKSMPVVKVIGIEPAVIGWSLELSPEVAAVVPRVIRYVEQWVKDVDALKNAGIVLGANV